MKQKRMQDSKNKKSLVVFLLITIVLSAICYYIRITRGDAAAGMTAVLMWCPAVAAFVVKGLFYRKEKLLGWNPCKISYFFAGIYIPIIYLVISYGLYWIIDRDAFTGKLDSNSIGELLLIIPFAIINATGEEIGWRGFLLPKLAECWNKRIAIIVTGLIWAVYHLPMMIAGLYQTGTPLWYRVPMFIISVTAITAIMAYLCFQSKSVWPAIMLHASHNYFNNEICVPLTNSSKQEYFVGETGVITVILMIIIVIVVMRKGKPIMLRTKDNDE